MMSTVCLIVLGIAGQFCHSPATLIGECTAMNHEQYLCVVAEAELPLFLSIYDPAICDTHPTNCDGDPDFGTGIPFADEWYEVAAACPVDWVWQTITVPGIGEWHCIDTGGRIHPQFREVWNFSAEPVLEWQWVIVLDVCYPHHEAGWPWWALQSYSEWSIT